MKRKACCFTGHRSIAISDIEKVKQLLLEIIKKLVEEGIEVFYCGGALGFDTFAAEAVLSFKKAYPHIKLIMAYPCKNQTLFWKCNDIQIYEHIKSNCDEYVYVSDNYNGGVCIGETGIWWTTVTSAFAFKNTPPEAPPTPYPTPKNRVNRSCDWNK